MVTYKQVLGRLPGKRILQQTAVHEVLGLFREPSLWRQPRRRLVDDMLQQLEDAHRHPATLQADPFALSLLLLVTRFLACLRSG